MANKSKLYFIAKAGIGGASYSLPFGGNIPTTDVGNWYLAHGPATSSSTLGSVYNQRTAIVIPIPGKLRALSWHTQTGDATTDVRVWKNGVAQQIVSGIGLFGATGLSGASVAAGDSVAIQYLAGSSPNQSIFELFIGP